MVYKNFSKDIGVMKDDTEVGDFIMWLVILVGFLNILKYTVKTVAAIIIFVRKKRKK